MEKIYELMPEGWREAAKTTGALMRSRNIQTPEELLRLNLLYQTAGETYGKTSTMTQISESQEGLNKTAVQKRIVNSGSWLKWLCENMSKEEGFLEELPQWLNHYRVCIVDASDYTKRGSKKADFRLHCMMELSTLDIAEMHFTTAKEGETLTRYETISEKDIIIADRGYSTLKSINHVIQHKADFLLRLRSNSFNLYQENGEKFDLTERLKDWEPGKRMEFHLQCKIEGQDVPIRVCAAAKTQEQIEESRKRTKKANKKRKDPSALQTIWNRYIVVITSLPEEISAEKILELYRLRWQIELVFKRFKSIFGGGEFSARKEDAVKAWFYGKLLLAIICETLVKRGRFSPLPEETDEKDENRLKPTLALERIIYYALISN